MSIKVTTPLARILQVGLSCTLPEVDADQFYTDRHFLDYEIVILDPMGAIGEYSSSIYDGELKLKYESGQDFHKRFLKILKKLGDFYQSGGTAIVFLRPMPKLNYGDHLLDLNKILPWYKHRIKRAHGRNIEFKNHGPVGQFWRDTDRIWNYQAVYEDPPEGPIHAHVKGHPGEVVAQFLETEGHGFILVTPIPELSNQTAEKAKLLVFVDAVRRLQKALRAEGQTQQLPDWAADYSLPGESKLRADILAAEDQISSQQAFVSQCREQLDDLSLHKLLVTGYGTPLEIAVRRVLSDLGMTVEPGPKGRVDFTATYGDGKFAIEVQGVVKGAKEDHARSLNTWVAEVEEADKKDAKGLLVVNSQRDTPLNERGDTTKWPKKIIEICVRHSYCAITGTQLLGLYLDAVNDNAKREILISQLFDTNGRFEGYEDWHEFLVPVADDTPKSSTS